MEVQRFNKLLKLYNKDEAARVELNMYCLAVFKNKLRFKVEAEELESISHSILLYFISHLPQKHIFAPRKYLGKCINNYLSTHKKKVNKQIALSKDIAYEQSFEDLEKLEIYNTLVKILGVTDAKIVFLHYIDEVPETEIDKILRLNLSYDAIRQRLCRSMAKLKNNLHKYVTKGD